MEQITAIKTSLSGRVDLFLCNVIERSDSRIVVVYRMPQAREVHGVWLPEGALTVGYFWLREPYNLYLWLAADGTMLAYYFNIGDVTAYDGQTLHWLDLAVDILATPAGRVEVLDEDELPPDLPTDRRRYVEAARDRVLRALPTLIETANRESATVLAALANGA